MLGRCVWGRQRHKEGSGRPAVPLLQCFSAIGLSGTVSLLASTGPSWTRGESCRRCGADGMLRMQGDFINWKRIKQPEARRMLCRLGAHTPGWIRDGARWIGG